MKKPISIAATVLLLFGPGFAVQAQPETGRASASLQEVSGVVFDPEPLAFGPATIASAHFLGSEPMVTIERPATEAVTEALDPDRIFVDWPLGGQSQIGQLARSIDGGDSFRLIFDFACASRSRPTCQTGGGGDTDNEVNPFDGNGTVYFSDLEDVPDRVPPANVAVGSSVDHGDHFPATRQFAVTNSAVETDRQWLAAIDPSISAIGSRRVHAFFAYKVSFEGALYIQAIDHDGLPIAQPVPQLPRVVIRSGPIRVDNTQGPGRGWIYAAYHGAIPGADVAPCGTDPDAPSLCHLHVATADAREYANPQAWEGAAPSEDEPTMFPWVDLDARGNAYVVWVASGVVYYSAAPIDDPRNDPSQGGRPGSFWTPPRRVTLPEVGSAIFPEVAGGAPGRIAISYDGTTEHSGESALAPPGTRWHTYAAVITDALGQSGAPVVHTGRVSHRVIHHGMIDCRGGCPGQPPEPRDTSLLDMIDLGVDADGRIGVVFSDNNSTFATPEGRDSNFKELPFPHFAKQVSGPSVLGGEVDVPVERDARSDPFGDATWPNVSGAANLRSLDLLGASIFLSEGDVVARIEVSETTAAAMERDLDAYNAATYNGMRSTTPADRLQYVLRLMTAEEIYHLSMEWLPGSEPRFFGGLLGPNDKLANPFGNFVAAGYHTDGGIDVSGSVTSEAIELRVERSLFGLAEGEELYSVTAFAMAGPREEDETSVFNVMRTVDATPPFDATLAPAPEPVAASVTLAPTEATSRPGTRHEITGLVTDAFGTPVEGAEVEWSATGQGRLEDSTTTTDAQGRATATVTSDEHGNLTVSASVTECTDDGDCLGTAIVHWGPEFCDVFGTDGNDFIEGTEAGEVVCGFGGADVIRGGGGDDVLLGGRGSDVIRGGGGNDILRGRRGSDRLFGGRGADVIRGGSWNDIVGGRRGSDRLFGGRGVDFVKGGVGDDELRGGRGPDRLRGGRGHDLLFGGRGKDHLRGGPGNDKLDGGPHRDECRPGRGRDEMSRCERRGRRQ